jgi:predicted RNA methylase
MTKTTLSLEEIDEQTALELPERELLWCDCDCGCGCGEFSVTVSASFTATVTLSGN